ncbi:MAG: HAMP domain-containing sensor histidine kinase [Pseudomonadota bacterium]
MLTIIIGWLVIALVATAIIVITLVRTNAERELRSVLLAHAYGIMGAAEIQADGSLTARPQIGDPRFSLPSSGWYWAITTAAEPTVPLANSMSIAGDVLAPPLDDRIPFDARFQRLVRSKVSGEDESRLEAQVYLGDSETLYQVIVAGNRSTVVDAIWDATELLLLAFAALILGTAIVTYLAVRQGLKPLADARNALAAVRSGAEPEMSGTVPAEIAPLVDEINQLARGNRATLERARHQVGNLAHALKTPLSAALNETDRLEPDAAKTIRRQLNSMRAKMNAYLDRARRGARREASRERAAVREAADGVFRVMRKLNPDLTFEFAGPPLLLRCDSEDLSEILGTVVENAARHARAEVSVSVSPNKEQTGFASIVVEDDGRGLTAEERAIVLKRGERLDEVSEGSGLGLSIIAEIASDYGGTMALDPSALGGLKVTIVLPEAGKQVSP